MDTLQAELEGMQSDNAKLRHESQLVMTNINHWISEQKYDHVIFSYKLNTVIQTSVSVFSVLLSLIVYVCSLFVLFFF